MPDTPVSRPWLRYLRFSVRGLLILVLLAGGALGWFVRSARIQRATVVAINGIGGTVQYDWEWNNGNSYPPGKSWVPQWVVDRLGTDYFGHVTNVWLFDTSKDTDTALIPIPSLTSLQRLGLTGSSITDAGLAHLSGMTQLSRLDLDHTKITDAGLSHLKHLTGLGVLVLNGTHVTDAGLANLKTLTNLAELDLADTQITDAGFTHLKGLSRLTILNVVNTKVTDAGMTDLKKALPDLRIYH